LALRIIRLVRRKLESLRGGRISVAKDLLGGGQ